MKPLSDATLDHLDALLQEATPGPWHVEETPRQWVIAAPDSTYLANLYGSDEEARPDAELIATAINALPALLAEVRASRQAAEQQAQEEDVIWPA